ncbi:hypothetical protein [Nocardia sp. alder85J]|uniref:hypothetical protein n=1 Tax=Nocardia sp. alder85J TaxID=2862949 RepID=UPI001CD399D1|nr:hypothetical protein [Nocardia sp. alder85J]MCX4092585.1 hypothetical protein [Nocardia sp. alder85J]
MLKADADQLETLARVLDALGDTVDGIKVRGKDNDVAASMPGSSIPAACEQLGLHIEGAYLRVGTRMRVLAGKIRDCAGNLRMTDDEFAQQMHALDFHPTGSR